jgi:hypothetical protein
MNKKIMLLALAAVSAAMLALPAMASALTPLHLNPTPVGAKAIDDIGANPTLSTTGGTTVECGTFNGSATFNAGGTTGSMQLTFTEDCHLVGGGTCNSGSNTNGTITTTTLPFDLATLANNKPGVLVTSNSGHFATFVCTLFGFPVTTKVEGNGVIGTITAPACGAKSTSATIDFNATAHGVQEHTTVAGTATVYRLKKGEENAAQDATGKLTLGSETLLECT